HVFGDLVGLEVVGWALRIAVGDGGVEKFDVLGAPLEVLEPYHGGPAGVEAHEIDAHGQCGRGVEPDLDLRISVSILADDGPRDGEALDLHSPDLLGPGRTFSLAFEFAEAAEEAEREFAGRRLGDDLVLLRGRFKKKTRLAGPVDARGFELVVVDG